MLIAFYSPMKPPSHPAPSGDRRMARLMMRALEAGGHQVGTPSRLRSYDGGGVALRQARIADVGAKMAARLIRRYRSRSPDRRPRVWFTYHLYHKAPDWLGPEVSAALGMAYVVAEASHAPKQKGGPWAVGYEGAARAISRADLMFCLNPIDAVCTAPLLSAPQVPLKPFIDTQPYVDAASVRGGARATLAGRHGLDENEPWLLSVAMMRHGDKLASYRILGQALAGLMERPWRLLIAGGGPARAKVAEALAPLGTRVTWLGEQVADALPGLYAAADAYLWPAVNEAYGMAFLEAQATGLPVVAGRTGGVPEVVGDTGILTAAGDTAAFAAAVAGLLDDESYRRALGARARARVLREHGLERAALVLDRSLRDIVEAGAR
jgi:glycosyltransferase involved in cell wall biosynthesis